MDYEEWVQKSKAYDKEIHEAQQRINLFNQKKADLALELQQEGFVQKDADMLAHTQKLASLKHEGIETVFLGTLFALISLMSIGFFIAEELYLLTGLTALMLIVIIILANEGRKKLKRASKIDSFLKKQSVHNQWKDSLKESLAQAPLKKQKSSELSMIKNNPQQ